MSTITLPATSKALVYESIGKIPTVQSVNTPEIQPGSAIVRVLAANIGDSSKSFFSGNMPFLPISTPVIPGHVAVGRIAAVGSDSVSLKPGQLVFIDNFVRARDDHTVQILQGFFRDHTAETEKLMSDGWRNSTYAEYARIPLENAYPLNEEILLGSPDQGGLGYEVEDLPYLGRHAIAYGGFRGIDLKAGETVIVAPATGAFSGTAVEVASAMGARVIAVGRNLQALEKLASLFPGVKVAQLQGDVEKDTATISKFGKAEVYFDFSPPYAGQSTHFKSCLQSLKPYGRVCLMGGVQGDFPLNYWTTMRSNITLRGVFMYEHEDARGIIKLAELGLLKLGKAAGIELIGKFTLDQFEKAIEAAESGKGWGRHTILTP